jgi:hypothetical protein
VGSWLVDQKAYIKRHPRKSAPPHLCPSSDPARLALRDAAKGAADQIHGNKLSGVTLPKGDDTQLIVIPKQW